jgi:hypothetical protein
VATPRHRPCYLRNWRLAGMRAYVYLCRLVWLFGVLRSTKGCSASEQRVQPLQRPSFIRTTHSTSSAHPREQNVKNRTGDNVAENLFKVSKRLQLELGVQTPTQTRRGTSTQASTTAGTNAQGKGPPISSNAPLSQAPLLHPTITSQEEIWTLDDQNSFLRVWSGPKGRPY